MSKRVGSGSRLLQYRFVGTLTSIFVLLTIDVISVKWQLRRSTSLDPWSWAQTGPLILVHFQRHLALKDRFRQRWIISSHGPLMPNSGIWTSSAIDLKTAMGFETLNGR